MRHFIVLTSVILLNTVVGFAESENTYEDLKIKEIIEGNRINCAGYEPSMTPTLNYEVVAPAALLNETSTQITLQMTVVYYRCQKVANNEPTFSVVDPKAPYQYDVEDIEGSMKTIKVSGQKSRFSAMISPIDSSDITKGIPARIESPGPVQKTRLDIPVKKLLTAKQRSQLNKGVDVVINVRVLSALSTEYLVGSKDQGDTGFIAGSEMIWELKFFKDKKELKVELLKLRSNSK